MVKNGGACWVWVWLLDDGYYFAAADYAGFDVDGAAAVVGGAVMKSIGPGHEEFAVVEWSSRSWWLDFVTVWLGGV